MQLGTVANESRKRGLAFDTPLPSASAAVRARSSELSWNVRAVGFIAKPEKTPELTTSVEGKVAGLLRQMQGFSGAMVLQSHTEARSLLVLTFWETEGQAATNCWEELTAVKETIAPIIDVCTRVQTFRATLPSLPEGAANRKPLELD
jgi:antibiotic biosynthesis monooxygenase